MRYKKQALAAAGILLVGCGEEQATIPTAPVPLFRDPVFDGAADPSIVFDPGTEEWVMFYTNRRATADVPALNDVSWVHGTHIGIATSPDGAGWTYQGVADIPESCTGPTLWAPEVGWFDGQWHLWVTVVPGIFSDWDAERFIVHLTSPDLQTWTCAERLALNSDKVIDAAVAQVDDGLYRMWYNDERLGKAIMVADSPDLRRWTVTGRVTQTPGEGPIAFAWKGQWWMLIDEWQGLRVLRSDDAETWTAQEEHVLSEPGTQGTDLAKGQHPGVIVAGDRAYIVYFVHQENEAQAEEDPYYARRTVLQIAELNEQDGILTVDRNAPVEVDLTGALPR